MGDYQLEEKMISERETLIDFANSVIEVVYLNKCVESSYPNRQMHLSERIHIKWEKFI